LEREFSDKPAGLRTNMLVSGAGALLVSIASLALEDLIATFGTQNVSADPVRIIEAVVTGISFLGAGTILRRDQEGGIEGLTTAASLLLAAAVGMCVGLSRWVTAVGATLLALFVLGVVSRLEDWIERRQR
jgi:putative Mg2+ transporter-C (MgtC) family protein